MANSGGSFAGGGKERRCICGSLLARLSESGVELKCRRCKRVVTIPWSSDEAWHGVDVGSGRGNAAAE
jgi:phage FluMu protein Com